MRSMLRFRVWLPGLLVLSLGLLPSCCRKPQTREPVQPVVEVRSSCVTPELRADRPKPIDETLMLCLDQGNRAEDCITHDARVREAYIERVLANCGVKP